MKLLLANHEYPPVGAGAATATQAIAREFSALGHDVVVLTANYGGIPQQTTEEKIVIHRIKCIRKLADQSNLFEMVTFVASALFSLPFILRKYRPERVIVFFSLPGGPIGLVANLFFGLPYLVSLRGGDVPGLVPELDFMHKFLAPLRRLILKKALAVVANSEGLQRLSEMVDTTPVCVITNGVDTNFFQPTGPYLAKENPALRILFVGRFQEQKNLNFLFNQIAQFPSGTFELHLVGDGPQEKQLRGLAEHLGIASSITWHGWLARAALPAMYQTVDCLVNPSLYEGMPNAVLEAMACGLPVIASNVPGNAELVMDGKTGFLFELEKSDTLLQALRKLMADHELRNDLGVAGRLRAVSEFSWRTVTEEYLQLLSR